MSKTDLYEFFNISCDADEEKISTKEFRDLLE